MNAEAHRQWRSPIRIALAALAALFFAMWIASYWTYTSLGIDRETLEPDGTVLNRYDRVRWPGDGSLWIGSGSWRAENWLGVPGWLPALVFALLAVRWRGARVEGRERPSPPRS